MKNIILKEELRKFGFVFGFGFPIIFGFLIPAISGHSFRDWTIWVGTFFLVITILRPFYLFYPYKLWMGIGHLLGLINSNIILGLVFILILLPIALIMKINGHDPLRKKSKTKNTFRELKTNHKTDLTRIF